MRFGRSKLALFNALKTSQRNSSCCVGPTFNVLPRRDRDWQSQDAYERERAGDAVTV
jgi:hypothetical protein